MVRPRPEQKAGGEENLLEGNPVCPSPLGKQGPVLCGLQTPWHGWFRSETNTLELSEGVNIGLSETVGASEG